jgi:hypothetical protein
LGNETPCIRPDNIWRGVLNTKVNALREKLNDSTQDNSQISLWLGVETGLSLQHQAMSQDDEECFMGTDYGIDGEECSYMSKDGADCANDKSDSSHVPLVNHRLNWVDYVSETD